MDNDNVVKFKTFVKNNPFLINYVNSGKKNWQDFYEIYDLYGEDEDAWSKYLTNTNLEDRNSETGKKNNYIDELINAAKNIDVDKVQEGITSLQKTLGLFGELFINNKTPNTGKEYNPRPLYRRFED